MSVIAGYSPHHPHSRASAGGRFSLLCFHGEKRAGLPTLCLLVACVAALLGCNAIDEAHFRAVSGARSHGNRASGVLAPSQPMLDDDLLGLNLMQPSKRRWMLRKMMVTMVMRS